MNWTWELQQTGQLADSQHFFTKVSAFRTTRNSDTIWISIIWHYDSGVLKQIHGVQHTPRLNYINTNINTNTSNNKINKFIINK